MYRQQPRIPQNCPLGFLGRYTVLPGDTFFNLAQMFRVKIETLAANNPHITNPNILYPGDVLCVPGFIPYPCCTILRSQGRVPFGTGGTAFVNFGPRGSQAVSFMATLPLPAAFGYFNNYTSEIFIPGVGGFGNQLFASSEDPPTWSARVELPTAASVLPKSRVAIRPYNSLTGASGAIILQGVILGGSC